MTIETCRELRLVATPVGMPIPSDLAIVDAALPELQDGEVLARNLIQSIDPYMRLQMGEPASVGKRLAGGGLGEVVESRSPLFQPGDLVRHREGVVEAFTCPAEKLVPFSRVDGLTLEQQMYALGGVGLCAYGGLLETGQMKGGETVFVSAAAGAVGSLAVQIAKQYDCHVIATAGSDEKCQWLSEECGADVAINYRTADLDAAIAQASPEGIDIYFDNVGGSHLDAAIPRMNRHGRIAVCGMISSYNNPAPVYRMHELIWPRVTLKGFGFDEFAHMDAQFRTDMAEWILAGKLITRETISEGIESTPAAIMGLFEGANTGKVYVRL